VDQIAISHQGGTPAEALLNLIIHQLDTSMGMLTLHGPNGDPPRILTRLNMPDTLALSIAASIDRDLAAPGNLDANEWGAPATVPSTVSHDGDGQARITFLHRIAARGAISLTAYRADHGRWHERVSRQLRSMNFGGWIEPILGLIWRAEFERALRDGLTSAIDRFDFGIVLLDADGSLLFANEPAKRLLDTGHGIRRAGQAIAATDFHDAISLQTAIRHDPESLDHLHVLLLNRSASQPLIAVVAALGSQQDLWGRPTTALYLLDPDRDMHAMVGALCRAHGLTATESLLTMHLVAGATVEDAANRMRIRTQTARAYLKQIFAKTGTHRQAELVRALLIGIVPVGRPAHLPV
jgi:DNA-binding CsgD family transcriptional regulator